ncbi:hypothetical protein DAETH_24950 [Deinococcus aetherius]|uniref:Uncharacterized protein n=1 Tax=Deinococcus aetherius TaxID=200252 RepID=A0ABM8AFV3_9DEIO|nr:hypothetical protein [Deinococcus aetherius]BDP42526.1 hypothetical protein DAETH_24950 [Deinococcus aetherius]
MNLKDEEVIFDIMNRCSNVAGNVLEVWQCQNCGRLYVEDWRDSTRLIAFKPENEGVPNVFAVPEPDTQSLDF